ncbi:hypothetical protein Q5752_004677 [Cryptotrichosporon argae]
MAHLPAQAQAHGFANPDYPPDMVYPPPPPVPGQPYHELPLFESPPPHERPWPSRPAHHPAYDGGHAFEPAVPPPMPARKRPSDPADAAEIQAGLALAGMTMAAQPRRASAGAGGGAGKKAKRESDDAKPAGKEARKSCSECRRLKAKCDRVFPCSNCRRRGCALVCPDGDLSCMQGKRLVLASTEQLHDRIAQLETALFQTQSKLGDGPHPLLAPQYLDGGFAALDSSPTQPSLSPLVPKEPALDESNNASSSSSTSLPTPRLGSSGRIPLASLLLAEDVVAPEKREDEWVGENGAPAMMLGSAREPTPDQPNDRVAARLCKLLAVLPPRDEARRRADRFMVQSVWYQNILRKDEYTAVYEPAVFAPSKANPLTPHKLACVLMVLAFDTYFDLETETDNNPAIVDYWDAAQQCFDTRFGWAASIAGVQALALMTFFVGFGWKGARATNFYFLRAMTSAVLQLGLHKDPHPSVPADERQFRRRVFHEAFTIDCLISINHGQRTAILLENSDTRYPDDAGSTALLKYRYMCDVKYRVITAGCAGSIDEAEKRSIEDMLTKYDATSFPEMHCAGLTQPMPPIATDPTALHPYELSLTTISMCHYKSMLFFYRPALRRLLARLRTSPGTDVVISKDETKTIRMTYNACRSILLVSKYFARTHPRLASRVWAIWVQLFSAAVSMAALAIWCGPHLEPTFVGSVFAELCEACTMIDQNGSERSRHVRDLLPVVKGLVSNRYPHLVASPARQAPNPEGEDMLFALLGGAVDRPAPAPAPTYVQPPDPKPAYDYPSAMLGGMPLALPLVEPAPTPAVSMPLPMDGGYGPVPYTLYAASAPPPAPAHANVDTHMQVPTQAHYAHADVHAAPTYQPLAGEMSAAQMWAQFSAIYEPTLFWGSDGAY